MKPNEALIWTLIVALCVADAAKVRHADEVQGNHSNQSGLEASALTKEEPPVTASTRQTNDTSLKSSAPMLNFLFMAYETGFLTRRYGRSSSKPTNQARTSVSWCIAKMQQVAERTWRTIPCSSWSRRLRLNIALASSVR
ncbi:unnamed protein product [Effrenium voratum]|nr:unnamed protein product [Effrenium voratum]